MYRLGSVSCMDERELLGCIRLHTVDGQRCWDATDGFTAARLLTEDDVNHYDVLVPHTIVRFGLIAGGDDPSTSLIISLDADLERRLTLQGSGGSLTVSLPEHDFPDFDESIFVETEIAASATVTAGYLQALTMGSRTARYRLDDEDDAPAYWFSAGSDGVGVMIHWPGLGCTEYQLHGQGEGTTITRSIQPKYLDAVLKQFESEEQVAVQMPADPTKPLFFTSPGAIAVLMPQAPEDPVQTHVESVIDETIGTLAIISDEDGIYPLQRRVIPVYGRIIDDRSPVAFQVFASLVDDVAPTAELLTELNDLNRNLGFARLIHADHQVLAQVDLVAASMDGDELTTAIERIVDIAERVMPMLAAVHGGSAVIDPEATRWGALRSMLIEAEVRPGKTTKLNGKGAASTWPFPGPVYVVSGWNPQGVVMDEESSASINAMIAQDILLGGGRFVHGRARVPGSTNAEPSLVAWGLSRENALMIGRKASRDAIFRIDADEVRLLSCTDDRTEGWERVG